MAAGGKFLQATVLIVLSHSAIAAPPPDAAGSARSPDSPIHELAREYAYSLFQVVAQVEQHYVRPVPRAELVEAALQGLYEVARQPAPASLHQDLQNVTDDESLRALIQRAREDLGDHDALRGSRALRASVAAMPRALDPFCSITGPKEFQPLDNDGVTPATGLDFPLASATPSFVGLAPDDPLVRGDGLRSIRPTMPAGPVRITGVQPGSPAQRAGVRPGDLIVAVDDKTPESPGFPAAFQRLVPLRSGMPQDFAAKNAPIRLRLLHRGRPEPIEVLIVPAAFRPESVFGVRRKNDGRWDFVFDEKDRIGYVRIGLIQRHTPMEVADALKSLRTPSLRGLVLDLRWCPGGLLRPAATIARQMLTPEQMPIATQRNRDGRVSPVEFNPAEFDATDFPIVVLVNGDTSGGGELIAAALQDHGRAAIAGQRTVGKSSVQEPMDNLGVPLKITTSILLRPKQRAQSLANDGPQADAWIVRPDPGREIPGSVELSRQLKSWWTDFVLRPVGSAEALPLDDPENDPQRQAAVQLLRRLLAN